MILLFIVILFQTVLLDIILYGIPNRENLTFIQFWIICYLTSKSSALISSSNSNFGEQFLDFVILDTLV